MSTGGTTGSLVTAIILDDVKVHLRIDDTDSDAIITEYIAAAVVYIEERTGRRILSASETDYFDSWTSFLQLSRHPLISLDSITYYDADNAQQTLSSSLYMIDQESVPARIHIAYNQTLPSMTAQLNGIAVNYTAGSGATWISAPVTLRQALYLLVGDWFTMRENSTTDKLQDINYGVEALINLNKTSWSF